MELLFAVIAILFVVALAGVAFCVWACVAVARGVFRLAFPRRDRGRRRAAGPQACENRDCRGDNPDFARFCRRCGRPLPALMRLVDARAA